MCDLIDLNSPDSTKIQAISKLASPLIPVPSTPFEKTHNIAGFIGHDKRCSLDNNPFDKVFKESSEYVAKRDDPFEFVLEKAQQNATDKYRENDFTPKRRRHSDILKMNKTLEEPLLQGILNKNFNLSMYQNGGQNIIKNLNSGGLLDDKESPDSEGARPRVISTSNSPHIIIYPPSPGNCSVLNNSAMNDSLSESSGSSGLPEGKGSLKNGQNLPIDGICSPKIEKEMLQSLKHRRSLSQGNKKFSPSPNRQIEPLFRPRSRSTVDVLKVSDMQSKSRASSASSAVSSNMDYVNNAFIETGSMTNSESFDFSRISGNPKLSYDSCGSVGSLYSCSSKNRAFILDSKYSRMLGSTSSAKSSLNLSSTSRSTGAGNFLIKTPLETSLRITDLELRFKKLKLESADGLGGLPLYSPNRKVEGFLRLENSQERESRLIDTDGFLSAMEREDCDVEKADSASNTSSDSVFVEICNVDQSVLKEAKLLARTFDELAHQSSTNSFSSGDDLLYSHPTWNFDILPVSDDDEAVVDNLIELPVSPQKIESDLRSSPKEDVEQIPEEKDPESKISQEIRELETEFIDQDAARNKVMAATLLLDLEKIVHRENNPEAITLLENLEKVLGVKYESNAQLLATCMQGTNNLNKSPKKYITKFALKENIKNESLERSDENNDTGLSNSVKVPKIRNDETLGVNFNIETAIDKSQKSIIADFSPAVEENKVNLSEKSNNNLNGLENEQKEVLVDQNEALELITNLSKILGGPNNDSSPLSLLTNLRQVLNLATNQLNFENSQMIKSVNQDLPREIDTEIDSSQKKAPEKPKLDSVKTGRKKSIDSSAKIQVQSNAPSSRKRSMSFNGLRRNGMPPALFEKLKTYTKEFQRTKSFDTIPKRDKPEKSSPVVPEVGKNRTSTIGGTEKYKLKKKSESQAAAGKKGPLKAVLPVGNMQRRGSISTKVAPISLSRTPPKSSSAATSAFPSATSSTPNPKVMLVASKKSPKTKPVASSTPDGSGPKARRLKLQFSKSSAKPKFSCNISPVTPLPAHSITGSVSSKSLPKNQRHNKTLSPPKRRGSQEVAAALNTTESSIPKYAQFSGFSRRNSKESVKATLENSGSPKTSAKSRTPKKAPFVHSKSESQIPQSPLKTMNSQSSKFKPVNLISKLRRGSNGSNSSDKENFA